MDPLTPFSYVLWIKDGLQTEIQEIPFLSKFLEPRSGVSETKKTCKVMIVNEINKNQGFDLSSGCKSSRFLQFANRIFQNLSQASRNL